MATCTKLNIIRREICERQTLTLLKRSFTVGRIQKYPQETGTKASTSGSTQINENVPGLSMAVLTTEEPVGPGAAKSAEYKVPEYFNYNKNSYYEAEVEMNKFRLPQPSALNK